MPSVPTIVITNESTKITDAQVQAWMAAAQIQVMRDFELVWGVEANLIFLAKDQPLPAGAWQLVFLDDSDQADALGYHELAANGQPLGKAFVASDIAAGTSWSVTASHELLEMLADPQINRCIQVDERIYALEVCDAVESDSCGYEINGVLMSDFVTPAWYSYPGAAAPYDFQSRAASPLLILSDGYMSVLDLTTAEGWTQIFARGVAGMLKYSEPRGSRRWRRKLPDALWRKSAPKAAGG